MEAEYDDCDWGGLPSVVLQYIYKYLSRKDRLNASSICVNWRGSAFQVPLENTLNLTLENFEKDCQKFQFLSSCFAHKVAHVSLTFDAASPDCMGLICHTLGLLERNVALKTLRIRYTVACVESPLFNGADGLAQILQTHFTEKVIDPLLSVLKRRNQLETLDFPLVQQFIHQQLSILELLAKSPRTKSTLSSLFLTTIRNAELFKVNRNDENQAHLICLTGSPIRTDLLDKFHRLQKLSIDHDVVTDDMLATLGKGVSGGLDQLSLTAAKRNPSITNNGWKDFVLNNPKCKVRLNVIGAKVVLDHNSNLCFPNTPLTHFRALYCHRIRMNMLNSIIFWNENRLEHLELINENQDWMDSIIQSANANHLGQDFIDPIIYAAWRVKTLRTIKIGYLYCGHDLIGVARLAKSLHRLEIPNSQILDGNIPALCVEVSKAIGRDWTPTDDGFLSNTRSRSQLTQRRVSRAYMAVLEENY